MKKKFAFNLAPVKAPTNKSQESAHPAPSVPLPPSQSHVHRGESDEITYPFESEFICRRPLTPNTERELRAACFLIARNLKASDHGLEDADPRLDFKGPATRREHNVNVEDVRVHRPTGAPSESTVGRHESRRTRQPQRLEGHHPDANTVNAARRRQPDQAPNPSDHRDRGSSSDKERRRAEYANLARSERELKKNLKSSSTLARHQVEADDVKSVQTQHTASTDAHLNSGSTAPTSASVTSGDTSKRGSSRMEQKQAKHAQSNRTQYTEPQPRPSYDPTPSARPPSRARSIRNLMFPGSGRLSRRQSQDSLSTANSRSSSQMDSVRSPSSHGWRSWGLQRMSSSRNSSRPGSSRGRAVEDEKSKKTEVNLNRELPPLPSLDTWRDLQQTNNQKEATLKTTGPHIATVMRTQAHMHDSAPARNQHRRSGSDTVALKYMSSSKVNTGSHPVAKDAPLGKGHPQPYSRETSRDFDELISNMDLSKSDENNRYPKMSYDGSRLEPPNFSRKISADLSSPRQLYHAYTKELSIAPPTLAVREENKSKLKKVLSTWMLKKEKQGNWMDQFEKKGIKTGVMIQDEAALPPVVRY
ncbi:uncharacterized protein EI97DRAFT_431856 [Westerdykella ornata]|uniref:Uncharacterized protein n=1 Tax=Westerdykella ornata TaxID=318751 RepID=A0A6A6JS38_WESOR|nr:uncharacterized protein EI97DRAFT_431856 [Westerdykella ornata]KAF2277779.1 hypothetical protein EI97DRAFT_431856 [Westerdykella ornata]